MEPTVENNIIHLLHCRDDNAALILTKPIGSGYIKKSTLSEGLILYTWNCIFNEKTIIANIDKESFPKPSYHLAYYLTPASFRLDIPVNNSLQLTGPWNAIFTTDSSKTGFTIMPGHEARYVQISFTKGWIELQFPKTELFSYLSDNAGTLPSFLLESSGNTENNLIDDIYKFLEGFNANPLYLKARVIALIMEFISKIKERDFSIAESYSHNYEINKIELKLTAAAPGTMPSLKELATEFCLSESTLRRDFKKVYGVSIGQFFIRKKMDYAYKMLSENDGNVSDIACRIGYEKVSRFIHIFKKYKGQSPGALLKQKKKSKPDL